MTEFFICNACDYCMKDKLKKDKDIEVDQSGNTPYDYGFFEESDAEGL